MEIPFLKTLSSRSAGLVFLCRCAVGFKQQCARRSLMYLPFDLVASESDGRLWSLLLLEWTTSHRRWQQDGERRRKDEWNTEEREKKTQLHAWCRWGRQKKDKQKHNMRFAADESAGVRNKRKDGECEEKERISPGRGRGGVMQSLCRNMWTWAGFIFSSALKHQFTTTRAASVAPSWRRSPSAGLELCSAFRGERRHFVVHEKWDWRKKNTKLFPETLKHTLSHCIVLSANPAASEHLWEGSDCSGPALLHQVTYKQTLPTVDVSWREKYGFTRTYRLSVVCLGAFQLITPGSVSMSGSNLASLWPVLFAVHSFIQSSVCKVCSVRCWFI